jgi:acetyl-CoA synthetase
MVRRRQNSTSATTASTATPSANAPQDRHHLGRRARPSRRPKRSRQWIRTLTYAELHVEVQRFANALKSLGIQKGDRVAVYMGMTPELAIALLACARIGAIHSVIFGGFAANAIADRVNDSQCVAILTQDTSYRRGTEIQLKRTVDEALATSPHPSSTSSSSGAAARPSR